MAMELWERDRGGSPMDVRFYHSDGSVEHSVNGYGPGHQKTYSYRSTDAGHTVILPRNRQELNSYLTETNQSSPLDNGHPFFSEIKTPILSHKKVRIPGTGGVRFEGPLIFNPPPGYGSYLSVPGWNAAEDGTKLINRAIPTHPQTSIATQLGELALGGLPRAYTESYLKIIQNVLNMKRNGLIPRNAPVSKVVEAARKGGSAYLNVYFGYIPMVNDLLKTAASVLNAQSILTQYLRDSGRPIRRRRSLESSSSFTTTGTIGYGYFYSLVPYQWERDNIFTAYPYGFGDAEGKITMTESTFTQSWFSGAFTYMVPEGEDFFSTMERFGFLAEKLLGVRPTAEVIWNIAPWSWLADWNANLGSIISNATRLSEDGLIMRYGYVMHKSVTNRTFTLSNVKYRYFTPGPVSVSFQTIRKERERGNPFGFSLSPLDYTSRQWAALAAVGLTGPGGNVVRGY